MYYVRVYIHIYIFHVPYVYTHNSGIYIYSTVQHIHKGCNNYVHVQEFAGNICNNYMIITLHILTKRIMFSYTNKILA